MAEVYTVAVDNATPVEITGGRVGHFRLLSGWQQQLAIGGSTLAVSYPGGVETLVDGLQSVSTQDSGTFDLYVTSPDEIYAVLVLYNSGNPYSTPLKIFHNR